MRRVGKIILEYTKDELAHILQSAISTAEKVSIEKFVIQDDKFTFHCIEGVNSIPPAEQIKTINLEALLSNKKEKVRRQWGLKKAIINCLDGGVMCPLDKIVEELKLKGFNKENNYIRHQLLKNKDLFKEVQPNVFQLV